MSGVSGIFDVLPVIETTGKGYLFGTGLFKIHVRPVGIATREQQEGHHTRRINIRF
jgi:hypothetical protein